MSKHRRGGDLPPMPRGGSVRVWMLAQWLALPSKVVTHALNTIEGVQVKGPTGRLDLSDPDFALVLERLALVFLPTNSLTFGEYAVFINRYSEGEPNLDALRERWRQHLLDAFWMSRRLMRLEEEVTTT